MGQVMIRKPGQRTCLLFHNWRHKFRAGHTEYLECNKCGARKAKYPEGGYSPVHWRWLHHEKRHEIGRDHRGDLWRLHPRKGWRRVWRGQYK